MCLHVTAPKQLLSRRAGGLQSLIVPERMLCARAAVSGNIPEEPVITSDGHVFEKRLVIKHLEVRRWRRCPLCCRPAPSWCDGGAD